MFLKCQLPIFRNHTTEDNDSRSVVYSVLRLSYLQGIPLFDGDV
jgi:hypothetical protein